MMTQQIKQTETGIVITHLTGGHVDPCANCNDWTGCQGCQVKPKAVASKLADDTEWILDGIDWEV